MIHMTDARQSAQKVEGMWHCHKLRLANGHAVVVTREWWDYFLRALDSQTAPENKSSNSLLTSTSPVA